MRPSKHNLIYRNKKLITHYPTLSEPFLVSNVEKNYDSRKLFNYSYTEFQDLFSYSRDDIIPLNKRIYDADNLFLSSYNSDIDSQLEIIKKISNNKNNLNFNEADKFLSAYKKIFNLLETEYSWSDSDYYLVPLKGGGVITELYDQIPSEKVIKIDSKRVPLNTSIGSYGFGMHVPPQSLFENVEELDKIVSNDFNNKTITILELCVASGITTIGFLLDLIYKQAKPKEIKILSTVISQHGYEISTEFAKEHDIDLKFITSKMVYALKDHYYYSHDPLAYDNGELVLKSPYDAFNMVYNVTK